MRVAGFRVASTHRNYCSRRLSTKLRLQHAYARNRFILRYATQAFCLRSLLASTLM